MAMNLRVMTILQYKTVRGFPLCTQFSAYCQMNSSLQRTDFRKEKKGVKKRMKE
jgi:hypothetical protein